MADVQEQDECEVMITCERLGKAIDAVRNGRSPTSLVILDVSWDWPGEIDYFNQVYKKNHIPGAFFFDFCYGTLCSEMYPNDIPNAASFEAYAQSFGINSDTWVIIYEAMPQYDRLVVAGRVWWLFRYFGHDRVSVLEGGFDRWRKLGYPITSKKTPLPEAGDFAANVKRPEMLVTYEEICQIVEKRLPLPLIVDPRLPCSLKDGAIPGSLNLPLAKFVDDDLTSENQHGILAKIREFLGSAMPDPIEKQPVIVTCHSGVTACGLACIAASAGLSWRVYIGSWTEWSMRQEKKQQ